MKIVVITGSPRKNGNSAKLVEAFVDEARKIGHEVTVFNSAFMKISGCCDCRKCYSLGKPCVIDDDFNTLACAVEEAEGIVLASPMYWSGLTSHIKAVLDRCACFYIGKRKLGKKSAIISCCDAATVVALGSGFTGVFAIYRALIKNFNGVHVGEVIVPKVSNPDDVLKTDGLEQARELARKF